MTTYIGDPVTRLRVSSKFDTVPIDTVIPHIDHLMSVGMRRQMIARSAGITRPTLDNILQRKYPTVTSAVARAILAATPTPSKHQALVMGYPTRRRLEGLAAVGWTVDALGEKLGRPATGVSRIRLAPLVQWGTHCEVRALFEELSTVNGGSDRTRAWAERSGFVHPFDWDDIEDFYEVPVATVRESARDAFLSELDHFRGFGYDDRRVASAMGMSLEAFQARVRRYANDEVAA
jgi:hypothetical protein